MRAGCRLDSAKLLEMIRMSAGQTRTIVPFARTWLGFTISFTKDWYSGSGRSADKEVTRGRILRNLDKNRDS